VLIVGVVESAARMDCEAAEGVVVNFVAEFAGET
jgi:hypothetical protein